MNYETFLQLFYTLSLGAGMMGLLMLLIITRDVKK